MQHGRANIDYMHILASQTGRCIPRVCANVLRVQTGGRAENIFLGHSFPSTVLVENIFFIHNCSYIMNQN